MNDHIDILLDRLHHLRNEKANCAAFLDFRGVVRCHNMIMEILAEIRKFDISQNANDGGIFEEE